MRSHGFASALDARHTPPSVMFRARVFRVNRSPLTGSVTMLFDVVPDNATVMAGNTGTGSGKSSEQGVIKNVALLMAGFGTLDNPVNPPTGIVYIPEEGSRVLVAYDGVGYVIVGFYTGPAKTSETLDDFGFGTSMNPGIETTENKVRGASLGGEAEWLFGANPGDVILGKGLARVKITSDVVAAGSGPNCMTIYKGNDEKLERCKELDARMVGYMKSHRVEFGVEAQAQLHLARPEAVPAPFGAALTTEIFEATPYPYAKKAFLIQQRGHVTNGAKEDARQAILGSQSILQYTTDEATGLFTVLRDAILKPLPYAKIGLWPFMETFIDHCIKYDHQVDSDGSWFIRSGNLANILGPVRKAIAFLDFDMSYDALFGTFQISVGKSGVPLGRMSINGFTGMVSVFGTKVSVFATAQASLESGASSVTVNPAGVSIIGPLVSITAAKLSLKTPLVDATGVVQAKVDVLAGKTSLATHTHPFAVVGHASAVTPTAPPV